MQRNWFPFVEGFLNANPLPQNHVVVVVVVVVVI